MKLRQLEREEARSLAPQIVGLWNRSAECDPLTNELLAEKVTGDPDFAPALTFIAENDDEIVGFGMAVHRDDGERGCLKLLTVDPACRRQGIASQVCDRIEAELAEQGATEVRVCESAPNYLTPGVDVRLDDMHRFLASRGYAVLSEAVNMRVELTGRSFAAAASGSQVTIKRAEPADAAALDALLGEHWPSWRGEVAIAGQADPQTLFVAKSGDRIVGFCAYEANNQGTGWFGPMGTDPALQGQGIGKALLLRTLEQMKADGFSQAIIPWVGPTEFYAKLVGAKKDRTFRRYTKSL